MCPASAPLVAVVLPPREGFGPGRAGAVGLLVRRLAPTPGCETLVIGGPQDSPAFSDVRFLPVRPATFVLGNGNLRYAAAVARALRPLRPALIEAHNRPEIALALAARLPGVPVTLVLHNDPQAMRLAQTPAQRTVLLRRMALVMTPSAWLRDRLIDGLKAIPKAPAVVPNCIDLTELPPPQPREQSILFAGRVVDDKAPDAFIAACAAALPELHGWRADVIGADRFRADSPDTSFVAGVRAAAERAGVGMLGYRDHPEVMLAMARAGIVVVPSRWAEPFGLVALEAMANGAPLICSKRGGLPEVAGNAALYAEPDEPGTIARAIVTLANDPAQRAALGEAGRTRAQRFDVRVVRERLARLRHGLIARASPAG
ncbi:glycosyltransferase family 4 protein [Rhodopila sp.]|jgi:glycosyltransferase involved in cell wall biosynthesis|uniref:glycosyltransferase family 4 protein n=1 Tax=Rhodopila sp. TaxID=2480087 RepID=UPI002C6E3630|nr:glycosyltransferase family 4 protein [Rhodopila sp.]HVZ08636.1 glycosyltransferase family 4 protein [Rhodopila sp.]